MELPTVSVLDRGRVLEIASLSKEGNIDALCQR
jgi:hypothetical protein